MAHDFEATIEIPGSPEIPQDSPRDAVVNVGTIYLVVAHRWGWDNTHSYYVYAGTDRTKALALAQCECDDRGGKYGCVVWEFDGDGVDYKRIAYFDSSMDFGVTDGPRHNHRIDYFERLGQFVDEAAAGKALLPDPANEGFLKLPAEALPKFLLEKIEREKKFHMALADADDERRSAGIS